MRKRPGVDTGRLTGRRYLDMEELGERHSEEREGKEVYIVER